MGVKSFAVILERFIAYIGRELSTYESVRIETVGNTAKMVCLVNRF